MVLMEMANYFKAKLFQERTESLPFSIESTFGKVDLYFSTISDYVIIWLGRLNQTIWEETKKHNDNSTVEIKEL